MVFRFSNVYANTYIIVFLLKYHLVLWIYRLLTQMTYRTNLSVLAPGDERETVGGCWPRLSQQIMATAFIQLRKKSRNLEMYFTHVPRVKHTLQLVAQDGHCSKFGAI